MTFTYDLASVVAEKLAISKVRMEIGDTVEGAGVRPNGSNLMDEEIAVWLDDEGDDVMRACARTCEALSRIWSSYVDTQAGPLRESLSQAATSWANKAKDLRTLYGGSSSSAFSADIGRVDGYSEAAQAAE